MTVSILLGHIDPSMPGRGYQYLDQYASHLIEQLRRTAGESGTRVIWSGGKIFMA